jgi:hypothetical protein
MYIAHWNIVTIYLPFYTLTSLNKKTVYLSLSLSLGNYSFVVFVFEYIVVPYILYAADQME